MDWTSLGLGDRIIRWLEAADSDQYAKDRRLDPYATSMRDFDDVSSNLQAIREGREPDIMDPKQRFTDLKNAGLVSGNTSLTELGGLVLKAWERYGVASDAKGDELARLLLLILEANKLNSEAYADYFRYWQDLRTHFDALALIDNWDVLYALNYLDWPRNGFAPGSAYRDERVPVSEIEFDLPSYANDVSASERAIRGGERIEQAIGGKVPRGRHRATFCMALEIAISGGRNAPRILGRFGFPKKPRTWTPFNETQRSKILGILRDYEVAAEKIQEIEDVARGLPEEACGTETVELGKMPALPAEIDFEGARVEPPQSEARTQSDEMESSGPRKIDGQQKARSNEAVGKLGEEFALRYEQWRLRNSPEYLKKLRHVSKEDDTLGYDIESFELNGEPRFVEVKGTLGPIESRFFISANELACAEEKQEQYVVLRVSQLGSSPVYCEIRFPFDGKLDLIPSSYSVTFSSGS